MTYWLGGWIENNEIRSLQDAEKVLDRDGGVDGLADAVREGLSRPLPADRAALADAEETVVAGRQVDLSGLTSCANRPCLIRELDEGLATSWHYFDRVVVEGLSAQHFMAFGEAPGFGRKEQLLNHVAVYLRAREIGALPHLEFRTKPLAFCAGHYREHARELGLPATLDDAAARSIIRRIAREGKLEVDEFPTGEIAVYFMHPLIEAGDLRLYPRDTPYKDLPTPVHLAREWFARMCIASIGDVALAQDLGCPLTSDVRQMIPMSGPRKPNKVTAESVALLLNLPVLRGATSEEVLRVRQEHQPEFIKFRAALGAAITERLRNAEPGDAREVARRIVREYVDPELADIRQKLEGARASLAAKAGSRVALATVATTVGVMTAMPLLVAGGVASLVSTSQAVDRFLDERREAQMSDMYFLVQAERSLHAQDDQG